MLKMTLSPWEALTKASLLRIISKAETPLTETIVVCVCIYKMVGGGGFVGVLFSLHSSTFKGCDCRFQFVEGCVSQFSSFWDTSYSSCIIKSKRKILASKANFFFFVMHPL